MILCAFAIAIGSLTVHRIRADFNRQVLDTANELPLQLKIIASRGKIEEIKPALGVWASAEEHTFIRLYAIGGGLVEEAPQSSPEVGPSPVPSTVHGYRVVTRLGKVLEAGSLEPIGRLFIVYGRSTSETEATVARVELFLICGVLAGTALALLAGMAIARRAMSPVAELTTVAADIARTRDPSRRVPEPKSKDEVSELALTLSGMLHELDAARSEREEVLARQRRFVADASHELRTPLTSVLANLELLAERSEVGGLSSDLGDAARSALRSSQRMRRLVADLLLLARTDVGRMPSRESCDLAQIVVEAAGELGPVSGEHEIVIDAEPAPVRAARDELHRLTINLIENAIKHTPAGTRISVLTRTQADEVTLVVEDSGPGVPRELAATLFERFVRGSGDRGGSFGLGLAIVKAVAEAHGGSVRLDDARAGDPLGARFVVRLPADAAQAPERRSAEADGSMPAREPLAS